MDFNRRYSSSFGYDRVNIPIQWTADRFGSPERTPLSDRLERLAEVRRSVVARGRALVANPDYPNREILQQVGRLLAEHLVP